jgi:hypothetical protein
MAKKKQRSIDTKLQTRSSAELMSQMRDILNQDIPDPSGGIASVLPPQKPHTILGKSPKEYNKGRKRRKS